MKKQHRVIYCTYYRSEIIYLSLSLSDLNTRLARQALLLIKHPLFARFENTGAHFSPPKPCEHVFEAACFQHGNTI
jgi:hypothetical protein